MANTFIDTARILVKSGAGGNGAVAFHREKYVAAGGPDGGDGGRGGDVILQVDDRMSTLMDFRYKRKYVAENGGNGAGKQCSGKNGAPLILKVPRGTVVRDAETKEIIVDMSSDEPFVLCRGGNGGWGNKHFATPTRQTPQFAKAGLPGKERTVLLELKLLADEGVSFVMADIPGIIEGAAEGAGLGHDFLRHIDRCRLLIHIVDVSGSEGRDPVEDFEAINAELKEYSPALASRKMLVAANKTDILMDRTLLEKLKAHVEALGLPFFELSAAAHMGVRELMKAAAGELAHLPPVITYEPEYVERPPEVDTSDPLTIRHEDDVWIVEGPWLQKIMANVNFSNYESRNWFDRMLRSAGLFDRLEEMGIKDGDLVSLYNLDFEYQR